MADQYYRGLEAFALRAGGGGAGPRAKSPADEVPEQLRRLEDTTPAVDVLPQPLAERAELAPLELSVQVAELACRPLPKLHGDDVPERVGGEVPEVGVRPVDVLQHALDDVRRLDAQVLAELRGERLRQVGRGHGSREQLPLELEAQDDVERVRDLVGIHADQARRDAVERTVKFLERDGRELFGERLLEARIEEAPRREAASDDVLPEAALGLVERR